MQTLRGKLYGKGECIQYFIQLFVLIQLILKHVVLGFKLLWLSLNTIFLCETNKLIQVIAQFVNKIFITNVYITSMTAATIWC